MLIPYGTDAPLYRPPWGTFSLILANVVLFLVQDVVTPESVYILEFGDGLHPVQWVMSAFAHADPFHLIGNMIFLFSFGMVVESMMKLRHFLLLYFAIAIVESILVQTMMLGAAGGGALGASGAIYGFMMVAAICAPGRNIRWIWFYFYTRYTSLEIPVLINGVFYFMFDFGLTMFSGFAVSTPFLHAIGGLVGIGLGIVAYRLNWFQLDGEDLWSRVKEILGSESHGNKATIRPRTTPSATPPNRPTAPANKFGDLGPQLDRLSAYLDDQRYRLAVMKLTQIQHDHSHHQLTERHLIQLINLGSAEQQWPRVIRWMNEYCERFDRYVERITLKKARIQLLELHKPQAAAATIRPIRPANLSQAEREFLQKIQCRLNAGRNHSPAPNAQSPSI